MRENVTRPAAEKRKIHYKNDFELCYMRHQYLRRVEYNPTELDMAPYISIIKHFAGSNWSMYQNLFRNVGFDFDDLCNIGKIHLVSFLGLFSLDKMDHKYEEFVATYEKKNSESPSDFVILNKDRANFTLFLKQRMDDMVRICRQKIRNMRDLATEEYYAFKGPNPPPTNHKELLKDHEKYGFRKVDVAVFKSIRKKVRKTVDIDKYMFQFDNVWYVAVHSSHKALALVDLAGAGMDPYDNFHNLTPEQIVHKKEEEALWRRRKKNFARTPKDKKLQMISDFIEKNKDNRIYTEELRIARKYLKDAGV